MGCGERLASNERKEDKVQGLTFELSQEETSGVSGGVKKDVITHTESYSFRCKEGTHPVFFKICEGT